MNASARKLCGGFLLGILVMHCPREAAAQQAASTLTLLRNAAQSILDGDLGQAEKELQSVLAQDPGEYHALNFLGVIRAHQHREKDAEALFQQVIARKPEFAGVHVNLGLLYVQIKRDEDAASQFEEALRLDPARTDALAPLLSVLRTRARIAVETGSLEKGLALLLRARKASPQDPDVLFDLGMTELQMSLLPDAERAFEDALAARKDDPQVLYALGRDQIEMAKFLEAKVSFERFLQLRPDDASGHYAIGLVLRSLQQSSEARLHFEKSVSLQPAQTEAYFQLGLLDLEGKQVESAVTEFDHVLQRDAKHSGALYGMGRVAFEKRDYPNAIAEFERAIGSDASLREAHYYLGLSYARAGRKEDSEKELETATQLEHEEVEKHRVVFKILNSNDSVPGATATPK
jgi:tetratricopeptide (TPR) repeat protein